MQKYAPSAHPDNENILKHKRNASQMFTTG